MVIQVITSGNVCVGWKISCAAPWENAKDSSSILAIFWTILDDPFTYADHASDIELSVARWHESYSKLYENGIFQLARWIFVIILRVKFANEE